MTRPDWDQTWLDVADVIARRSRCVRAQVGAVIVDPTNRIVATGYNGLPAHLTSPASEQQDRRIRNCSLDCPRATAGPDPAGYDNCLSIHAEANALLFCDRREREGGTIYSSAATCFTCAKLIANSGLARAVVVVRPREQHRYPERSLRLLRDAGVSAIRVDRKDEE